MIVRRLIMLGVLALPATARAALPPCLDQLEHAPPGGTLSAHQNDVNNNCLRELQTASVASDLAARIAESDRKQHAPVAGAAEKIAPSQSGSMIPGLPGTAQASPSLATPGAGPAASPAQPVLPRIVMIVSDGNRYVATLRMEGGNTIDAMTGSALPDGTRVAVVTASSVYIRRGKTLVPLGDDDGTSPAAATGQDQTFPGMTSQRPGAAMGRSFP